MTTSTDKFAVLASEAYAEFGDVGDFIWKSPKFIDFEKQHEAEKLNAYFPLTGKKEKDAFAKRLRIARWAHESHKLENVFPFIMASGNLFASASIFETHCHRLCREIERHAHLSLSSMRGNGISRYLKFFSNVPIELDKVSFYEQVRAILLIRNCLFHASGLLELSRDSNELRNIISNRRYWSEYTRKKVPIEDSDRIAIVKSEDGDRILLSNEYVHTAIHYFKFFFIDLCKRAQKACTGECTIQLPTTPHYID